MRKERVKLRIIGERIKSVRKNAIGYFIVNPDADLPSDPKLVKRGMTQIQFAEALGVSLDTVKNWEQGYNYPRIEDIERICTKFHCRYDYLFGADDKMQEDLGLSETALIVLRKTKKWGKSNVVSSLIEDLDFIEALLKIADADYSPNSERSLDRWDQLQMGTAEIVLDFLKLFFAILNHIDRDRKSLNHKPLREILTAFKFGNLRMPFDLS